METEAKSESGKRARGLAPIVGGLLTLGAGLLSLLNGVLGIVFEGEFSLGVDPGFSRFELCGVIVLIFGTVAIAGGIAAIKGKHMSLALAGAILGMLGGGLVGFWLGLAALIVFASSNEDF